MSTAGHWAVALSGGPDSLALAALLATHQSEPGLALIVDHGLRAEAAQEAQEVAVRASALGLTPHILGWTGDKPQTGLMEAAREARYGLLIEACHQAGCTQLYLGHQQDDLVETALFRLARGSGWRGMAGMPDQARRGGVWLNRPLLHTPKAILIAYCAAKNLAYVQDPSNSNPRFQRARLRLSGGLAPLGFDQASLAESLTSWRVQRQAELETLRALTPSLWQINEAAGFATIDEAALAQLSPELQNELCLNLAQTIGQARYRHSEPLLQSRPGWTVMGCRFLRHAGKIHIAREVSAIAPLKVTPGRVYWDQRFDLELEQGGMLAPLGAASWRGAAGAEALAKLPGFARAALPGLFVDGKLVAVPKPHWRPLYEPLSQIFRSKSDFKWLSELG